MTAPYATRDDVFTLGLSAQAFTVRPRSPFADNAPANAVDPTTASIRLKAHGCAVTDLITFEVTSGGALPTAIGAFTPYFPVPVTSDLLRVSLTPNGTPIASWVSAGSGWGIVIDPGRRIDAHILEVSAEIDECLTAHLPPILVDPITGKYPQVLVGITARMAARAAVLSLAIENAGYRVAVDRLFAREADDKVMLAAWKAGKPLQPRPTDNDAEPDNGALAEAGTPVNWRTGML